MEEYNAYEVSGYDHTSRSEYDVVVNLTNDIDEPVNEYFPVVPDFSLSVSCEFFIDDGVNPPVLCHCESMRFPLMRVFPNGTGGITGLNSVFDWLLLIAGVPYSAAASTLELIVGDFHAENPTATNAMAIITVTYLVDDYELEAAIHRSEEEVSRGVPAARAAVEALEKVVVRVSEMETTLSGCVICLDDFLDGYEATRMPCSHVFHGDCIVRWFENSPSCPLCRFELPAV